MPGSNSLCHLDIELPLHSLLTCQPATSCQPAKGIHFIPFDIFFPQHPLHSFVNLFTLTTGFESPKHRRPPKLRNRNGFLQCEVGLDAPHVLRHTGRHAWTGSCVWSWKHPIHRYDIHKKRTGTQCIFKNNS